VRLTLAIVATRAHEAYFYCLDNSDPDGICAFQQYTDSQSAQESSRPRATRRT
jgi:hypothetical protein